MSAISLLIILILLIIYYLNKKYSYWKNKNVIYAKPVPIFGNYINYILQRKHVTEVLTELCKEFKKEPYFGTYYGIEPALVVMDPDLIKLIYTKDFYYFNSRELMAYNHNELTTQNLFFQHNDHWKVVRQNMTPLFSSMKLKNMFYLIEKCNHVFEKMLDSEFKQKGTFEAKDLMIRYTMDCICSCAFGCDANVMEGKDENPFSNMGQVIFTTSRIAGLKLTCRNMCPNIFYSLGFKYFPTEIDQFFNHLVKTVFEARNYEPSSRNDFIDLLLSLKKNNYLEGDSITNINTGQNKKVRLELNDELMISQCVGFFGAGFETSASVSSATLYELAKNQEAQRKAQKEIDEYLLRHQNKLSYDCFKELPYLEACVNETMRLYPVLGILSREVTEDYQLPSGPKLEKGLRIHLPVQYLHRKPEYFPNPEQYIPERFLPGALDEIKPYTYFPFGEGPRTCIGMRFAKMQVFPGLVTFLKKFHLELAEGTPHSLRITPTAFLTQPSDDMLLKWTLRDGWEQKVYTN